MNNIVENACVAYTLSAIPKIVFILYFILSFAQPTWSQQPIRIGVSAPLSGNAASYGIDMRNAIELANNVLAQGRYSLTFEDDLCDPKTALSIAQKFVAKDKIKYVLGSACSGTTARVYERAKVVMISPSASAAAISDAGDYIFRTWASDADAAIKLFEYMAAHHNAIGVLSEETEYSQGFLTGINKANQDRKITLVNENFITSANDYRTLLLRLKAKKIKAVFINSQSEATFLAILKQIYEMKLNVAIYSAYWAGSETFLKQAGTLAEGIVYVDGPLAHDILNEQGKYLIEKFVGKYGEPKFSRLLVATSIEAFRALDLAIRSGSDVKEYLYKNKFQGSFGEWSFDSNGDILGLNFVIYMIRGDKRVPLD
jgi:branched-chain amino acid transport system substrate-binding protein